MKKLVWKLINILDNNHGYSTPLQKRFDVGDIVKMSIHKKPDTIFRINEEVKILETGRHDYLVENIRGLKAVVYQFELS
jgi:hypothetical protein